MRQLGITKRRELHCFHEWNVPSPTFDDEGLLDIVFFERKELWLPSMKALSLKNDLQQVIGQKVRIYLLQNHTGMLDYELSIEAKLEDVEVYHMKVPGHGRAYNQLYLFLDKSVWEYGRLKKGMKLNKANYFEYALNASHISKLTYQLQ